ncbi:MAG: hypothetical protein LBC84_06720 [Prevotellaceae bacterium]|jgi:hypothetical protein|nr:hypothetical protein [Prevotellaceae bacterium]
MKKGDVFFFGGFLALFVPFILSTGLYRYYQETNQLFPFLMAFVKFAILATAGESLGLRLQKGRYNLRGYGLFPRAVVWGLLGVWIAAAIKLYGVGAPRFMEGIGLVGVVEAMSGGYSWLKLAGAFSISFWMNTTFAPVFMVCHRVTDAHILKYNGSIKALVTPLCFGVLLSEIDWKKQWSFVFKKTIPLFWIPAHTITFLLPSQWQVLFAALLGVVLGVLLSIAATRQKV